MVRDNLERSQEAKQAAHTQGQGPPPGEGPGAAQSPGRVRTDSQEAATEPTKRELDLLYKFHFEEEPETWDQVTGAEAHGWPTHLRSFNSAAEYRLVRGTYLQLQHSAYYWGPMTMEEAHQLLACTPLGTFLIRDSGQSDIFFTLSYQSDEGPTSVRIQLSSLLFSLYGSQRTFPSLFALLSYYTGSACKLTAPYRKQRPERLKQMCRRALTRTFGAENISHLPGLGPQVKDYVQAYPCSI